MPSRDALRPVVVVLMTNHALCGTPAALYRRAKMPKLLRREKVALPGDDEVPRRRRSPTRLNLSPGVYLLTWIPPLAAARGGIAAGGDPRP